jgi:dipeptidyl aminopeptidase/acylaminoacyl peptidase
MNEAVFCHTCHMPSQQVPVSQSIDFVQAIAERAGPGRCEFDILPGAGHGSPEFETPENVARVFAFLDRRLRS